MGEGRNGPARGGGRFQKQIHQVRYERYEAGADGISGADGSDFGLDRRRNRVRGADRYDAAGSVDLEGEGGCGEEKIFACERLVEAVQASDAGILQIQIVRWNGD